VVLFLCEYRHKMVFFRYVGKRGCYYISGKCIRNCFTFKYTYAHKDASSISVDKEILVLIKMRVLFLISCCL
jgi:hypothetical protein